MLVRGRAARALCFLQQGNLVQSLEALQELRTRVRVLVPNRLRHHPRAAVPPPVVLSPKAEREHTRGRRVPGERTEVRVPA